MISDKEEPYISVIITAHNRKEFLKDAINSVLNQTFEKSFYEIIVIKNFEDQEIDNLIDENKIISLKTRDDSLIGEDLALGIERAKGEVISFLDDDDLFMPKKLETVYNYFKKYENLVYLHNSEYFIDEKGNPTRFWVKDLNEDVVLNHVKDLNILSKLRIYGLFFNMSSISVRKNKILPYLENLKKINSNQDDFVFFISLYKFPNLSILLKQKLTKYRIHQSTTVFKNIDKNVFVNKQIKSLENYINNRNFIMNLIKDDKLLSSFLYFLIIDKKLQLYFIKKIHIDCNDIIFYFNISIKSANKNYIKNNFYYISLLLLSKLFYKKINEYYVNRLFKFYNP
ncbi:MAG: glycosyltransferase family 2 protein [Minisyncoccia bacterium]